MIPWELNPWRTGRKVGRTIYAMVSSEPSDDDVLIGVMDTPSLAARAVEAHNRTLRQASSDQVTVRLSKLAYWAVCGLVQSSDDVETTGIYVPAHMWAEIRTEFPVVLFRQAVEAGDLEYLTSEDPE